MVLPPLSLILLLILLVLFQMTLMARASLCASPRLPKGERVERVFLCDLYGLARGGFAAEGAIPDLMVSTV